MNFDLIDYVHTSVLVNAVIESGWEWANLVDAVEFNNDCTWLLVC